MMRSNVWRDMLLDDWSRILLLIELGNSFTLRYENGLKLALQLQLQLQLAICGKLCHPASLCSYVFEYCGPRGSC